MIISILIAIFILSAILVMINKIIDLKINKTTIGQRECNACGDEGLPSLMKQEKEYLDNQIDASIKLGIATLDSSNPPHGGSGVCLSNNLTYKGAIFKIAQLERKEELELEGALKSYKKTKQEIKEATKKEIDKIKIELVK